MSEYVPTTEQVREWTGYGRLTGALAGLNPRKRELAFNRWLAAHDREVKAEALRERRQLMSWNDPCPYNGPAHDFEPLTSGHKFFIGNRLIVAICRKCGVYR